MDKTSVNVLLGDGGERACNVRGTRVFSIPNLNGTGCVYTKHLMPVGLILLCLSMASKNHTNGQLVQ